MEDPVEYKINLKTKDGAVTKTMMDSAASEVLGEMMDEKTVLLDFTNYQAIYYELRKQAELSSLPLSHVIFNLLSFGLISVHEEEKRRDKEV